LAGVAQFASPEAPAEIHPFPQKDSAMITSGAINKEAIRSHYDWATLFYRLLWGVHIHHGVWDGNESPSQAQVQLIDRLATASNIVTGSEILDVGCGMGGTAMYLASRHSCRVVGITISRVQRHWARLAASLQGIGQQTQFLCRDVETVEFLPRSFDVVWSVECTEHLFDKARFFQRAGSWLRPGGRVAICAWLAAEEPREPAATRLLQQVCEGFLCPSLGTAREYLSWMEDSGLRALVVSDLTTKVANTWKICERRVRRCGIPLLARCAGQDMSRFVQRFETMTRAYCSGALRYGYFVAMKPS
jgi:tocopherol O-methyltransferase